MFKRINEIDKFKLIMPKSKVRIDKQAPNQVIGLNYKLINDNCIIEMSGKLLSSPTDIGKIDIDNKQLLIKKINEKGLYIDDDYFYNDAKIGIVHVKKDIFLPDDINYYLSELREKFKRNTDKYDVYRYGNLKYIDGLSLVPKAKYLKHRIIFYKKFAELMQNRHQDLGYFSTFNPEYLESIKNILRIECQYSSFKEIRNAFSISEKDIPSINNIFDCKTDVVAKKITELINL